MNQNVLILYTTAVCNLKCTYCFIDKNPSLVQIDNILDESFQGDYYFNFAKEIFTDVNQLKEVQFWGGEPTLRLDRAYYTVQKLIKHYPNLYKFMLSSNMTNDNFIEQIYGLLKILGAFSERSFEFNLQMSLDGPAYITDVNRGKGTTERLTKNFMKLITSLEKEILNKFSNIVIKIYFKPTLNMESINQLQTKQSVINYYKFFETYYKFGENIHNKNFYFIQSIPNTACPTQHTKEDGIKFANLVRICREIEKENKTIGHFSFYKTITPFDCYELKCDGHNCGNCGSGIVSLGLLPNHLLSMCHNGFVELISDYKRYCLHHNFQHTIDFNLFDYNSIKNDMIFPKEQLDSYIEMMQSFFNKKEHFQFTQLYEYLIFLAQNGQILEKYSDEKNAKEAANYFLSTIPYCMRDNLGVVGSKFIQPQGLYKLLFNGAYDYIKEKNNE